MLPLVLTVEVSSDDTLKWQHFNSISIMTMFD